MQGCPQRKAICLDVFTEGPKKPNSAQRPVIHGRVTTGYVVKAHIPGIGHNVQEHGVLLLAGGGPPDLPGVKYHVIRGTQDASGVEDRNKGRSRYGTKKPKKAK